jgi:hypothetical protein
MVMFRKTRFSTVPPRFDLIYANSVVRVLKGAILHEHILDAATVSLPMLGHAMLEGASLPQIFDGKLAPSIALLT